MYRFRDNHPELTFNPEDLDDYTLGIDRTKLGDMWDKL